MNQLLDRLNKDLQNEDSRYAYADALVNNFVSAQIKALREERNLSQEQVAELIGTKQSGISRLEKADYSAWKVDTLRKLAKAFGVRLDIGFKDFGSLLPDISGFTKERLTPKKFEDDPAFKEPAVKEPAPEEVLAEAVGTHGDAPPTFWLDPGGDQRDQEELERVRAIGAARTAAGVQSVLAYMAGAKSGQGLMPDSIQWNASLLFEQDALKILGTRLTTLQELAGAAPGAGTAVDIPPSQPPSPERIHDRRYNGLSLVPERLGAVPQEVPKISIGTKPHPGDSVPIKINRMKRA